MALKKDSVLRFIRYTAYSTALFIPDYLFFLFLLTHTPFHYVTITLVTFAFGITLQYIVVRRFVFTETKQQWDAGYLLFFTSSCVGGGIIVLCMIFFIEVLDMSDSLARILAAIISGYLVYLFNVYENFRTSATPKTQPSVTR